MNATVFQLCAFVVIAFWIACNGFQFRRGTGAAMIASYVFFCTSICLQDMDITHGYTDDHLYGFRDGVEFVGAIPPYLYHTNNSKF